MNGDGKAAWEVLETRIDWLTATAKHGSGATELLDAGLRLQQIVGVGYGGPERSYFEGYSGSLCSGCFAGWRTDGACVRLSGATARDHALELASGPCRITRVDVAITARTRDPDCHIGQESYRAGCSTRPRVGKPNECSLIVNRSGGETAYFGVRASERFGRLYNKSAQSKGEYPDYSWRWEIEYKAKAAQGLVDWLQGQVPVERALMAAVRQRFEGWGVILPFDVPSNTWRDRSIYGKTDNSSRMKWLAESVAPSIERLAASYSRDELLRQLGLWHTGEAGRGSIKKPAGTEATTWQSEMSTESRSKEP